MEEISGGATRATSSVANYNGVKVITLAFYAGDTEVYKSTQLRANESSYTTFGEFACSLPMGSYTMVVLGYGGENAMTLSSKNCASFPSTDRVRETFVYTENVNVTNTASLELSATLSRVVSQLGVISTDSRTTNAAKIRTTFSAGGQAVDPTTGLSTTNTGFSNTIDAIGAVGSNSSIGSYIFLNSDQQTMDITIDVLDENNNSLSQKVVNNVPLRRNQRTILKGSLYTSAPGSASFSVETTWLSENNIEF
ncbi:MAG: hypothetical protein IKI06_00970 [Prevotella sp.]|nr:hypothetical protein [Prevotella sp.]